MERACEFISFLLDGGTVVSGSSVLFGGAPLPFLAAHIDFMQLLLVSLFLQAAQGPQNQRRLALYRRSYTNENKRQQI